MLYFKHYWLLPQDIPGEVFNPTTMMLILMSVKLSSVAKDFISGYHSLRTLITSKNNK